MVAQIAEKASCKNVLTKGAKKIACSVEQKGLIARAIPKTIVSIAQVIPAIIPANIIFPPRFYYKPQ